MTNFEKYKDEILEVLKTTNKPAITKDGRIVSCFGTPCEECILYLKYKGCSNGWEQWVNTEYVESKVFTDAEKAVFKACKNLQYAARDADGDLYFFAKKPSRIAPTSNWIGSGYIRSKNLTDEPFNAIKVEDEEPTSREEILGITEADE